MLKRGVLLFLFYCLALRVTAAADNIKTPVLLDALNQSESKTREQKLVKFIKDYFKSKPVETLATDRTLLTSILNEHNIENREAFEFFAESIYQSRLQKADDAITWLRKAIDVASKSSDHYLLYYFFNYYAFSQSDAGNTIDAVQSFGRAKKEAILVNDYRSQVIVDINISDIYYKNNFFAQSLSYLNQAQKIASVHKITEPRLINILYYNKAENYYRMAKADSLLRYNQILNDATRGDYKIYIFRNRTGYYLDILNHNYAKAINAIKALRRDNLYKFDDNDEQNLATAFYNAGMPDSAKAILTTLLNKPSQNNHPEIKLKLYELLGNIAEQQNDSKQAAYNFKMAVRQSTEQNNRLTQVGSISSKINIEEIQSAYIQREEAYQRQRLLLIFVVIVAVLIVVSAAMFYRNITQKRYYEKLLFFSKKEELAFINSHEVRRHLSNILGIVDMIRNSEDKDKDFKEAETHLLTAAQNLDEAIRNISEKLDSDTV